MRRIKLTVAYDGTDYCGWQIQPNGITIEQVLNEHLSRLLKEDIKVTGASRTDAGVHSLGNVCMFDTNTRMPAEKISYALNQKLPEDIVVVDSCEVSDDFHPRFSKSRKTYEYRILNARFRNPTRRLDTYFYHYPLDTAKMSEAAKYLIGEHDFASFCSANSQAQTTVRTIYDCTVSKTGDIITIRVTGNGFLYNMVRIMVGTLLRIQQGKIAPDEIPSIIEKKNRKYSGPTAQACGLYLNRVNYENDNSSQKRSER